MNLPTLSLIVLLPLAASAALAAEDIYRSTMPNGDIRYGESPAPGAKSVRKIPAPPTTTGVIVVTPEDKARAAHISPQTEGGVTVIPTQQARPPTGSAEAGTLSPPGQMPKRSY